MMRLARIASCAIVVLAWAAPGRAQTTPSDEGRYYAAFDAAATFGHQSSGAFGAEGGFRLSGPYTIYAEGGHMNNVGTRHLEDRALSIANAVGATASTAYKVNYFDAGIRYEPNALLPVKMHPYVLLGFGVASVKADTAFSVNGTTVPPESLGISLGDDLGGTVSKPLFILGGGVTYPLAQRYFLDGSFRYTRIFAKTSVIEDDEAINTARLQIGIGVRF
jgi:opacity protein-like surface antigen